MRLPHMANGSPENPCLCGHWVDLFRSDAVFMDSLVEFAGSGLSRDQGVLIIATPERRHRLVERLRAAGVWQPRSGSRLLLLDAAETLRRFMVNGWPDQRRFAETITGAVHRVSADGRNVRAFGEMVALLWESRAYEATVRLEFLWDAFRARTGLTLLCGYPEAALRTGPAALVEGIHRAHDLVLHSG